MPYEIVENFAAGLDTRKNPVAAPAGTLTRLVNATITPGGEIAKRRAFVKVATVPATCFGLAATESALYVFGRNVDVALPAWSVPDVKLRSGKIPNADPAIAQTDFDVFDGQIYLACHKTDFISSTPTAARRPHYYFGPRDPAVLDGPYEGILTEGAGKGYYIRTFQTKMYTVLGQNLYFSAVGNPVLWNAESYIDKVVVSKVDNTNPVKLTVPSGEFNQFVKGNVVLVEGVTVAGLTGANGYRTIGNVVGSPSYTIELTGVNGTTATADQVDSKAAATPALRVLSISNTNPAVATVSAGDIVKFIDGQKVRINGVTGGIVPPPPATNANANVFVINNVGNPINTFELTGLNASNFTAPQTTDTWATVFSDALRTGQGFINISTTDAASENLTSLEVYYDQLAIFSTQATQIWTMNPDPSLNQFEQLLRGSGTRAARSPLQYGSGDVLFLDSSGIRSLKAKDSSNSAAVSDIGSPVDPTIREMLFGDSENIPPVAALGQDYLNGAVSLLEPSVGRFWMVFKTKVLVLSYFPGPDITAWSTYTLPFNMTYAVSCGGKLFFRDDANGIWVYGGANGDTYDNCGVELRLPYMSGKKPGHNKTYEALDITATGTWEAHVSYDYNNPNAEELVGTFGPVNPATSTSASTWNVGKAELQGYGSHISLRFYNNDTKSCTLSNIGVHYQMADDEA